MVTSGQGRGLTNPVVRISMKRYTLHFSQWHDLYYVIETEFGRGRVIYAHAWRMCAQYVAELHQSQLSLGEGAETCPDIQSITAMTQRNALFPCPAIDASQRPFGKAPLTIRNRPLRSRSRTLPRSVESHFRWSALRFVRRFRRRLARVLRHSLREHDLRPGRDLPPLIESRC
jgi:hypothetical protein